jgi:hypothetical protein
VVDFSIILNRWLNIYKYNDIMQAKKEGEIWNEKNIIGMFYVSYYICDGWV